MGAMILSPQGTCCQQPGGGEHAAGRGRRADDRPRSAGGGQPLLLIPYTSADHACYAFQLPSYTEHFSCIAVDLPGSGESDKPAGPYSTEGYADQVADFLAAIGVESAHVAGVSLGAAVGMHLAARHPGRVRSLSLHSAWHASDEYLKVVLEQWRTLASTLPTVAEL